MPDLGERVLAAMKDRIINTNNYTFALYSLDEYGMLRPQLTADTIHQLGHAIRERGRTEFIMDLPPGYTRYIHTDEGTRRYEELHSKEKRDLLKVLTED